MLEGTGLNMIGTGTSVPLDSAGNAIHAPQEFAIVEHVARIVSSVYGAKPDYTRLAAELAQAISFDVFGIVLLHHDRKAVRVTVCQRDTSLSREEQQQRWVAHYHQHPFTDSMLEQLLHETALIVSDYPHGLDGPPAVSGDALSNYPQLHATCIVPLRTKERILGTLELGSIAPDMYSDAIVQRLISGVAQVLATAFERTQLEGSSEIQDRQRQALKDVSRALTSTMDLSTILTHITDGVAKALDVASAIITLDQREEKVQLVAQSALDEAVLNTIINDKFVLTDRCIIGSTLHHRQSYMSNDIERDERFPASHIFASVLLIHSVLSYPLVIENTIYGTLLLCSPEAGGFTPLKSDIVALFATQATIAIHNATLLEAAHQRHRFQDAIEQLEQEVSSRKRSKAKEYALLARVREEAQRTFGVSLTSILRFVSDNLLASSEHDVRLLLQKNEKDHTASNDIERAKISFSSSNSERTASQEQTVAMNDTLSLLTQTTYAVLTRTGIVSELSALLMQVQHPTKGIKDAWFVTDLHGTCIYMNPVAEAFCHVQVVAIEKTSMSLEQVFVTLLSHIRNDEEVRHYLQDFTLDNLYKQELRCVVALEPLHPRAMGTAQKQENVLHGVVQKQSEEQKRGGTSLLRTMLLENAPSDSHYLFTRHPLHNQQGQLTAYALQVREITNQVRDEKNKSALLSSVSHDLRTPLTTIKAAVTGLLQTDLPWDEHTRREMLEDIDAETDHLTVLVSALVEMSRIEMGALILEKEWCDMTEVVYETLIKAKRVLAMRNVKTQFQSSLPLLFIDHVQIGRVLYNLLENAARHSPEDAEILIKADVIMTESTQAMIRVQVVDEGCGIPQHEQERIFKSFYGLRSYGSGLGLAICKGIIETHHGRIWVEPTKKGSCFVFTLPTELSGV
ncbi:MAG: hypothetical protein PVS3B3_04920 [Ktedonobacteraceae bacterium]